MLYPCQSEDRFHRLRVEVTAVPRDSNLAGLRRMLVVVMRAASALKVPTVSQEQPLRLFKSHFITSASNYTHCAHKYQVHYAHLLKESPIAGGSFSVHAG